MKIKKSGLPKGVIPLKSGRFAARAYQNRIEKYLGSFDVALDAGRCVEAFYASLPKREPKSRKIIHLERNIRELNGSYFVAMSINNALTTIGTFKSLEDARRARDEARAKSPSLRPNLGEHIKVDSPNKNRLKKGAGKMDSVIASQVAIKKKKTTKPSKEQSFKIKAKSNPVTFSVKKPSLPPTISFKPPPKMPDLTGIIRNDGVYFINGAWLVFITKNDRQSVILATSSENARRINEAGGAYKVVKS